MMDEIKIDPERLTLGDLEFFEQAQSGVLKVSGLIGVLSRLTGLSEDAVRSLNLKDFRSLTEQLQVALKEFGSPGEASGGNSTATSGVERVRRHSRT